MLAEFKRNYLIFFSIVQLNSPDDELTALGFVFIISFHSNLLSSSTHTQTVYINPSLIYTGTSI